MSIPGFGIPTPSSSAPSGGDSSPDDAFAGMGLPDTDDGGPSLSSPVGVFSARCIGAKTITAKSDGTRYLCLEFEITDPGFAGEQYSLMAAQITSDDSRADAKRKVRNWMRIGSALQALGLAVNPKTQMPIDGLDACAGLDCQLAVSTYDKNGEDVPTIVWGNPKKRQRNGVEVGFPADLADDRGRFRDYGCGVLPA